MKDKPRDTKGEGERTERHGEREIDSVETGAK
jgi:hypothetical protein